VNEQQRDEVGPSSFTPRNLGSKRRNPSPERMPWWASTSEMVTAYPELRVRFRVQGSGCAGWTYVVWVGTRVVFHGWRPTKQYAWRAVKHYLGGLVDGSDVKVEEIA
jgi:hypothetical protein